MKIKKLHIQNFKSLVDFQLEDMPQFCAFVGPNASGKSNIFEAVEFSNYYVKYYREAIDFFGGKKEIFSFNAKEITDKVSIQINDGYGLESLFSSIIFSDDIKIEFSLFFYDDSIMALEFPSYMKGNLGIKYPKNDEITDGKRRNEFLNNWKAEGNLYENDYEFFIDNFSRIFIGKSDLKKINQSSNKLLIDGSNTAQILGQIFQDDAKREDFIEWLRILIPEFENIDVKKNEFDGSFHIFVKEKTHDKHFPVTLLSDGTKNILALMAAVYQSNQPQFLCVEEPENGLHPHAIELLVDFFREKCETEGHHIWLNTHSPTLVRCLAIDEVITVNKINGETKARQFKKEEVINMKMDEAWLTNALGGGVSWSK
jgi:predicted ATPase